MFGTVIVLAILIIMFSGMVPFAPRYIGDGDVVMRSWVEPQTVKLKDGSTAWVEIKNTGNRNIDVIVYAAAKSSDLVFMDSGGQVANQTVQIGAGESRNIPFEIQIKADYEGSYGVSITVVYDKTLLRDELFLNVRE